MKRFAVPLIALCALIVPLLSHAEWQQKELFFRKSGVGPTGTSTGIWVRDTLYAPNPIAISMTADTTADFSLGDAAPWANPHAGAATTVDTLLYAYLLLQQDSTGAAAPGPASITYEIDGRAGGYGPAVNLARYSQFDSTVATFVTNGVAGGGNTIYNYVLALPLRAISGLGGVGSVTPEGALNFGYKINAFDNLRVRITAAGGVMSGSVRCFLRYWRSDAYRKY